MMTLSPQPLGPGCILPVDSPSSSTWNGSWRRTLIWLTLLGRLDVAHGLHDAQTGIIDI